MKTNVKTPRGLYIVKRAERALLNERIRSVNNMINMLKMQINTCMDQLETCLGKGAMEECKVFIKNRRDSRHNSTLVRQLLKFERLCHKNKIQGGHSNNWEKQDGHSNIKEEGDEKDKKWIINTSDTPLTEVQVKLLAHGPNFAVVPKHPPIIEVITSIEETCQRMVKGEVEELRGEIKAILRKIQPPKSNISLEEQKAMSELRSDNTRVILTADKGVSLVVMNKEEYVKKAEELLHTDTYRTISNDPTNKYKTKLINLLKTIKSEGGSVMQFTKGFTQQGQGHPNFMDSPKSIRRECP